MSNWWTMLKELTSAATTTNAGLTIAMPPHERWRCSKGHEFTSGGSWFASGQVRPWAIAVLFDPERPGKPLCPYCYVEWIEANVPTVKKVG